MISILFWEKNIHKWFHDTVELQRKKLCSNINYVCFALEYRKHYSTNCLLYCTTITTFLSNVFAQKKHFIFFLPRLISYLSLLSRYIGSVHSKSFRVAVEILIVKAILSFLIKKSKISGKWLRLETNKTVLRKGPHWRLLSIKHNCKSASTIVSE